MRGTRVCGCGSSPQMPCNEAERLLNEMKLKSESLIEYGRRIKPQYYLWASMASDALGEKIRARKYLRKARELDHPIDG